MKLDFVVSVTTTEWRVTAMFRWEFKEALGKLQCQLDRADAKKNSLLIAAEMIRAGHAKVIWRYTEQSNDCFVRADNGVEIHIVKII